MKLYYVACFEFIKTNLAGISKKLDTQIKIFEKNGLETTIIDTTIRENKKISFKIYNRLPFVSAFGNWKKIENISDSDVVYIRYEKADYQFVKKLKEIRYTNPDVKLLVEIPTYPYQNESKKGYIYIPHKMKDYINRRKMHKYVDRIVTYSKDELIFDVPTIRILNGVDIDKLKARVPKKHQGINVIAVASFANWHGYDRFIKGLYKYYVDNQAIKIVLHLVGDGEELEAYKQLVNKYNLHKYVVFHGRQVGKALDEIYDECDIALDAMGRHRSNVYYNSTLKGKEYAAKGIPIISGVETELDSDKRFKYYYRIPADETSVNMQEVIKFYNDIYGRGAEQESIVREIRDYAKEHFEMQICLKPVIDYIKGE